MGVSSRNYTEASPAELREAASAQYAEEAASFERCDTDGFLSQWASGITGRLYQAQADIAEAGGLAEFPALFNVETGEWVPARLIDGRYGTRWAIVDRESNRFTGEFIGFMPKRRATNAAKGYTEGRALWPAKAVTHGSGTGLSGAASVTVITVKTVEDNVAPTRVLCTDRFAEGEDA